MKKLLIVFPALLVICPHGSLAQEDNYSLETGSLNLCGRTFENYEIAHEKISKEAKLKSSDENFIMYQDDKNFIFWYFTTQGNAAHPSLVCQKLMKVDGETIMANEVVCSVDKPTCDYLKDWFAKRASLLMKKTFGKND